MFIRHIIDSRKLVKVTLKKVEEVGKGVGEWVKRYGWLLCFCGPSVCLGVFLLL
jgi:hypothetical protein